MKAAEITPPGLVRCPVCGRDLRPSRANALALPHCDKIGQPCPMSGHELGQVPE